MLVRGPPLGKRTPLCVDLDGTLSPVDTLHEQALHALGSWAHVLGMARSIWWGRAAVKQYLADAVPFSAERLPYHDGLLQWLLEERSAGRRLVLVTGANEALARAVARHLGIFDEVVASDARINLKGGIKAQRLVDRFGERGFAYVGNDASDMWVWKRAASAILVGAQPALARAAAQAVPVERAFPRERHQILRSLIKALRPHQWLKNVLVFVPIVTARAFGDTAGWRASVAVFLAFCALASSAYPINDLADLSSDRAHAVKRRRPIAAGEVSVLLALLLAASLSITGMGLAWLAGAPLVGLAYLVGTILYSTVLKTLAIVDVFALGGLYTVRVIAGGQASGHLVSEWLLAFSGFLFLSLGAMKRVAELRARGAAAGASRRRPYQPDDARFLEFLGMGASVTSALVLALYAQAHTAGATRSAGSMALWLVSPVMLFWQMRLWLSTFRGFMLEDPLAYAARDWVTRLAGVLVAALFVLSGL